MVNRIYYKGTHKYMCNVPTREEYLRIRGCKKSKELVQKIRQAETVEEKNELKKKLFQFNYSCMPQEDGSLAGSKVCSNSVGMDIDLKADDPDYQAKMEQIPDCILALKEELGLLLLERSACKGYHLVFKRRQGMSQEENLKWASDLLGVEFDTAAKDITRVFFATTDSPQDLLFLSDELFSQEPFPEAQEVQKLAETPKTESLSAAEECPEESKEEPLTYQEILISDIIRKYWELYNGGKTPEQGDRNAKTFELALVLRTILGFDLNKLKQAIPQYDHLPEAEWIQVLKNALGEPRRGVPARLNAVLRALKTENLQKALGGSLTATPALPKRLPGFIKFITSKVPEEFRAVVAENVFPALGAHLHGVKFRHIDNKLHEATFMNLLMASSSTCKGLINEPIDLIMADIKQRDAESRRRENEYKQKNPTGKTKKDPRPLDICIQWISNDLTNAAFNQRLLDANQNGEKYLYLHVDELEGLAKITSSGKISELTEMIRKAFDNADHGQERISAESVTGIAPLRLNFNASTTPVIGKKLLRSAVSDGTLSRLSISTIIKETPKPGEKNIAPRLGDYDDAFKANLKQYIDRLNAANGEIKCSPLTKIIKQISEGLNDRGVVYQSDAYVRLGYRALVLALLKGYVLYILEGYKWSTSLENYVRWSMDYDLHNKMRFFGDQLEEELNEEKLLLKGGPKNILIYLPDEFSREDYLQKRQELGMSGTGDSTLRSWKNRGYIEYDEVTQCYIKTQTYKNLKFTA